MKFFEVLANSELVPIRVSEKDCIYKKFDDKTGTLSGWVQVVGGVAVSEFQLKDIVFLREPGDPI